MLLRTSLFVSILIYSTYEGWWMIINRTKGKQSKMAKTATFSYIVNICLCLYRLQKVKKCPKPNLYAVWGVYNIYRKDFGWNWLLLSLGSLNSQLQFGTPTDLHFRKKILWIWSSAKMLHEREWIFEYLQSYSYVHCAGILQQQGNKRVNASDKSEALGHNEKNIWDRWRMCWQTSKLRH